MTWKGSIGFLLSLLLLGSATGCGSSGNGSDTGQDAFAGQDTLPGPDVPGGMEITTGPTTSESKALMSGYYDPIDYQVEPSIEPYTLPLDETAVGNLAQMVSTMGLSPDAKTKLLENGFVVVPLPFEEKEDIGKVYEAVKERWVPPFVTTDTWLHLYHVQFDEILKELEETRFYVDVVAMTDRLIQRNADVLSASEGLLREAAHRNLAFLWVARSLLVVKDDPATEPTDAVPDVVQQEVEDELALIEEHKGFSDSPLFLYKEDYSQYVPRGHYTRSELLKSYFRTLMWYGRMTMLLKGGTPACEYDYCPALIEPWEADVQTAQSLLLSVDLNTLQTPDGKALADLWGNLYQITAFFVGLADDLTYYEYLEAIDKVLGAAFTMSDLIDPGNLFDLRAELARMRSPEIYGGTGGQVIWVDPGEEITPEMLDELLDKSKGFRLMGQRFIPDSYAMGQLVSPGAGELNPGASTDAFTAVFSDAGIWIRGFPRGLDVMALMGSQRARELLTELGDDAYTKYDESYGKLEEFFAELSPQDWHRNLYWGWLYSLKPLLEPPGPGTQTFMQTQAWVDRSLTAALASWAELRHDTILYAKQSYTPSIEGTSEPPKPPTGYVDPNPEFFARLAALNRMTLAGLGDLGALPEAAGKRLENLQTLLERMLDIAVTELNGLPISEADGYFLANISGALEGVLGGVEPAGFKTTLIADVHTDQNSKKVLEEGVGYVELLVATYRLPDGSIAAGAGPVFSYYEFLHPMKDRLTDEAWREMLETGKAPEPPPWSTAYRAP